MKLSGDVRKRVKQNIKKLVVLKTRVTVQFSDMVVAAHLSPTLTCMERPWFTFEFPGRVL